MRVKLRRKKLSSHPKVSATGTKKHAVHEGTMYSSNTDVSSQQNVISYKIGNNIPIVGFPKSNYTKCMFSVNYPSVTTEG